MEALYIKLRISKSDTQIEAIREEGLLFKSIADVTGLDRTSIEEVDEYNYLSEIENIKNKYSR